jgi:t-SNARE complex subunit (syntaxin)
MSTSNNEDSNPKSEIEKLNWELGDVHQIMAENINLIIDRDRTINSMNDLSDNIKKDSGKYKKKAYETRIKMLLSKYTILIAIAIIFVLVIVFKIYF